MKNYAIILIFGFCTMFAVSASAVDNRTWTHHKKGFGDSEGEACVDAKDNARRDTAAMPTLTKIVKGSMGSCECYEKDGAWACEVEYEIAYRNSDR